MTKVILVGIHHKPGKPALCSTTPSGKKIDAVIEALGEPCEKKNLFSTDYLPKRNSAEYKQEIEKFLDAYPGINTFVLLGKDVQEHFPRHYYLKSKIINFRHPAFSSQHFVNDLINAIQRT